MNVSTEPRTKQPPRPSAFTLVELLVVIALILLLVGLLLPALRGARAAAFSIRCASNLRTVGSTAHVYLMTCNSRLPVNSYALRDDPAAFNPPLPSGTIGTAKAQLNGEGSTSNYQWHDAVAAAASWRGGRTIAARYAAGEAERFRAATQYLWCPDV